jgi:hypothetical protein
MYKLTKKWRRTTELLIIIFIFVESNQTKYYYETQITSL